MIEMVQYSGAILLALWAVNIWVFFSVIEARPGITRVALWAAILLIPLFGWIAWFLIGPRPAKR